MRFLLGVAAGALAAWWYGRRSAAQDEMAWTSPEPMSAPTPASAPSWQSPGADSAPLIGATGGAVTDETARDPVCGMEVSAGTGLRTEYAGVTYSFCSQGCLDRFLKEPDLFTAGPGEGRVADNDRALHPRTPATSEAGMGPTGNSRLEQAQVDAGPG